MLCAFNKKGACVHRKTTVPNQRHKLESTWRELTGREIKKSGGCIRQGFYQREPSTAATGQRRRLTSTRECYRASMAQPQFVQPPPVNSQDLGRKEHIEHKEEEDKRGLRVVGVRHAGLCVHCVPGPVHAPLHHNGPEIWEQAQAERSGDGMGQTGGALSFLPSLNPFFLWCPVINLPSAHSSFIRPAASEHSAPSFLSPHNRDVLPHRLLHLIIHAGTVQACLVTS